MIGLGYTLYFDEDYKRAFDHIKEKNGKFLLNDMKQLLKEVMGFNPLEEELVFFYHFSGKENLDCEISWEEILATLNKIRSVLDENAKKAKNYTSFGHYYLDHYHHRTAGCDPNIPYRSPVTKGMNYGFYDFDNIEPNLVNNVYRPLVKCPETLFAESLIKSKYVKLK